MRLQDIGRKIKLYYQLKDNDLILAKGSEFKTNTEKALALAFLNFSEHQSTIKRLLKKEIFSWMEIQEIEQLIPQLMEILPQVAEVSVVKILRGEEVKVCQVPVSDLLKVFHQLNFNEKKLFMKGLSWEENLLFNYLLGQKQGLQEELITHPNVNSRYLELANLAQQWGVPLVELGILLEDSPITQSMLNLDDLEIRPEQIKVEQESLIKVFHQLLWKNEAKVIEYYTQLKDYLPLSEVVQDVLSVVIEQDLGDKFVFLTKVETNKVDLIDELLTNQSWNCLEFYLQDEAKLNLVVEKFFKQAESLGLEELFIQGMEKIAQKHLVKFPQLPIIQKIALQSSNFSHNKFHNAVWDWLQEKLALNYFSTGQNSFAKHYPGFYQDLCELERFNLFYSLKDFQKYINEIGLPEKMAKNYLQGIVEIIQNRVVKINLVLSQDLQNKFNGYSQQVFSHNDLAVLSAYLEKLQSTEFCLKKINSLLQKDSSFLEQFFKTDQNLATIPNLKGFHLGELKIGGLENYQGHGKQIREILNPLGLMLSPDIRKEVDHYLYIKDSHRVLLNLVESKNYRKILTNQNSRMWEIKNQKRRLDEVVDEITNQKQVTVEVNSKIVLNRGLTYKSQNTLQTDDIRARGYNEAQGVLFNFAELEFVVKEETEKLCQLINKKKQFQEDLFVDKLTGIAHLVAMLEEDGDETCSTMQSGASKKAKDLFEIVFKTLSARLVNSLYYQDVMRSLIRFYQGIVSQREVSV